MTTSTLPPVQRRVAVSPTTRVNLTSIVDWDRKPGILVVFLKSGEGHEIADDHPSYDVIVEWLKAAGMMEDAA